MCSVTRGVSIPALMPLQEIRPGFPVELPSTGLRGAAPHCLKKNGTSERREASRTLRAHLGSMGRALAAFASEDEPGDAGEVQVQGSGVLSG
jgi:hypothetical protein